MTARRLLTAAGAAACAAALSACGAAAGSTPLNSQTTPPISASAQKFCNEASAAMASLSGENPSNHMSLAQARKTLDTLLNNGIQSFTKLESEAPADLRDSIGEIVTDLRGYELTANKATTVKKLLESSVTASPEQKRAYQELLGYLGTSC